MLAFVLPKMRNGSYKGALYQPYISIYSNLGNQRKIQCKETPWTQRNRLLCSHYHQHYHLLFFHMEIMPIQTIVDRLMEKLLLANSSQNN